MASTEEIWKALPIVSSCAGEYEDTLCAIGPYMAERIMPRQRFRITRNYFKQESYTIEVPLEVPTPDIPLPTVVTPEQAVAPEQPPPPNRCRATYTTGELLSDRYYSDPLYSAFEQGSSSTGGAIGRVSGLNQIYNNGIRMYGPPADTLCIEKFNKQFGGRSNLTTGRAYVWKADKKDGEKAFEDGEVRFSSVVSSMAFFGFPSFTSPAEPKYYTKASKDKYSKVKDGKVEEYNLKWLTTATIAGGSTRKKAKANRKEVSVGAGIPLYTSAAPGSLYGDPPTYSAWLDIPVSGAVWSAWAEASGAKTGTVTWADADLSAWYGVFTYYSSLDASGPPGTHVIVTQIASSDPWVGPPAPWDGTPPSGTPSVGWQGGVTSLIYPTALNFLAGSGDQVFCRIGLSWTGSNDQYSTLTASLTETEFTMSESHFYWTSYGGGSNTAHYGTRSYHVINGATSDRKWDDFTDPEE